MGVVSSPTTIERNQYLLHGKIKPQIISLALDK